MDRLPALLLELTPPPPRFSTEAGDGRRGLPHQARAKITLALPFDPPSLRFLPAPRFRSGKQTRLRKLRRESEEPRAVAFIATDATESY